MDSKKMELIGSSGNADKENRLWTQCGKESVGQIARTAWKLKHYHM